MNSLVLALADGFLSLARAGREFLFMSSELFAWSLASLFYRKGVRRGEFVRYVAFYGAGALPIVGVIMFLIGFISSLQSAAQLKIFGANVFVADLLAIGMTAEMGPLMAAIVVAGRSGSAIASEIATMKFTEELDALVTLGLNPLRYVMVPKVWSLLISMPFITLFANAVGILGGTFIAIFYLDLSFPTFWNELVNALTFKHLVSGFAKSLTFGALIAVTGCFQGVRFKGGAEGVGRATTASVVMSIFLIITADALLGLIFYFP